MATYFGTNPLTSYTTNSGNNRLQEYTQRIAEQQQDVDAAKSNYSNKGGDVDAAKSAYSDALNNQRSYSDIYKEAQDTADVQSAKESYDKSNASVLATRAAMLSLPSSINANSDVVLNSAQKNAALSNQQTAYQKSLDLATTAQEANLSNYQTALGAAENYASSALGAQQAELENYQQNYATEMNQLNTLYDQVLSEKELMRSIYGDMYDAEYDAAQQQIEIWAANLEAETARYEQEQSNYRAQLDAAATRYAAEQEANAYKYLNGSNSSSDNALSGVNNSSGQTIVPDYNTGGALKTDWSGNAQNDYNYLQLLNGDWWSNGGVVNDIWHLLGGGI